MTHTCNPSTQDVVVGASEVQDHLQVHSEVKSNLTCARCYIKKKKEQERKEKGKKTNMQIKQKWAISVITKSSRKTESLTFCS